MSEAKVMKTEPEVRAMLEKTQANIKAMMVNFSIENIPRLVVAYAVEATLKSVLNDE